MVDTGATNVAMGAAEAERIGIDYKKGQRGFTPPPTARSRPTASCSTAVRVGDVKVYNVDAMVMPAPMPYVLLGNSFLTRFQMRRENDRMTLEKN